MDALQKILQENKPQRFADFLTLSKKIQPLLEKETPTYYKKLKIALLSSFTTKGLAEVLKIQCLQSKISPEIYTGDYNQYAQEILDPENGLYGFQPNLLILFVDLQTLLGDFYFRPYEKTAENRAQWVEETLATFQFWIQKLKNELKTQILVHDFQIPHFSPLGILENKQPFGFIESIQQFNLKLQELYKNDSRVFVFNYNQFCSEIGKKSVSDPKMYYLGDMKLDVKHFPALCENYLAYLTPLAGLSRKCIVLDLDNTLWGGVVGEDGYEGIHLGPTPQGRPFWEFQQYLLSLFQRGVILAINSRNNPAEALHVLRDHPYMILKEKHFAALQINWNDKATNLRTIAEEINLGMDSLIFLDDDKVNSDLVRTTLPEVLVIDLPEDPTLYPDTLKAVYEFNTLQFTDEDQSRGASYASQRLRENLKKEINIQDYLKSLETTLIVQPATSFSIPRIAQLTQKTNQFNMTTRRYLEADIQRFAESPHHGIWTFEVTDKFGDLGIIAVAIVEKQKAVWRLDTFLMSCRVLGRKVEETILAFIYHEACAAKAHILLGEFIATEKNEPAKNFYQNQKFTLKETKGTLEIFSHEILKNLNYPAEIKVKIRK